MSVLTYIESSNGKIKKNGFELASYSCELAKSLNTDVVALTINAEDVNELSNYGIKINLALVVSQILFLK
jgi:electron transfer flavoprotein alpha subunit